MSWPDLTGTLFRTKRARRVSRFNTWLALCLAGQALAAVPATAQPTPKWIRVALVQSDPQVDLQIHGPFKMLALHTGAPIREGRRLAKLPVRAVPEGLSLGDQVVPYAGVRIEPAEDATISLNGTRLRGTLEIVRQEDLTLLVVNHVALEDYLRGVLSKEAPDYWPAEALRAIAIAARTYAIHRRFLKEDVDYDVTGDVLSQEYGGQTGEKVKTSRAVKATEGLILMYQGKLFPTFYHSTCGGRIEHARVMGTYDLEPLQGGLVCHFCSGSPFYRWKRRLTKADVAWALRKSPHGRVGTVQDVRISERTPTGRIEQITIVGSNRTLELRGYDFRTLFGFERIRSLKFSITPVGDLFVLQGHGWGHGVGMCQWGAAELARRGYSAEKILAFYYPTTQLVPVASLADHTVEIIGGGP